MIWRLKAHLHLSPSTDMSPQVLIKNKNIFIFLYPKNSMARNGEYYGAELLTRYGIWLNQPCVKELGPDGPRFLD